MEESRKNDVKTDRRMNVFDGVDKYVRKGKRVLRILNRNRMNDGIIFSLLYFCVTEALVVIHGIVSYSVYICLNRSKSAYRYYK